MSPRKILASIPGQTSIDRFVDPIVDGRINCSLRSLDHGGYKSAVDVLVRFEPQRILRSTERRSEPQQTEKDDNRGHFRIMHSYDCA